MNTKLLSTGKFGSGAMVVSALAVTGILTSVWFGYNELRPQPIPYSRVLVEEGGPAKFPDLGLEEETGLVIRKYEIRIDGINKALAEFHVTQKGDSSLVPLSWENKLAEPVFISNIEPEAPKEIAEVIGKYLPDNATVLGWWDISRLLKFYQDIPVEFDDTAAGPIFVPGVWSDQVEKIQQNELGFWGEGENSVSQEKKFTEFTKALLLDERSGADALQKIVGDKRAYVVVNLLDSYKIGAIYPEKFGVGFKDFPRTKQSHGQIKGVKSWVEDNGYTAYSVFPLDKTVIRVFFLTDEASENTTLAKLLPFNTTKPGQVPGTRLVYQLRGYWIYELTGTEIAEK